MLEIIICDDEKHWREIVKRDVDTWSKKTNKPVSFSIFSKTNELLQHVMEKSHADVLFLDVEFGEALNGIEAAHHLRDIGNAMPIIFVSGHGQKAHEGYNVDAVGFLVKEYQYEQLEFCLEKALRHRSSSKSKFIMLESEQEIMRVPVSQIEYAESFGHEVIIHTNGQTIKVRRTLSNLLAELGTDLFVQTHKSFIVAIQAIVSVKSTYPYTVGLRKGVNGTSKKLPVGRSFFMNVQKVYTQSILEAFE